MLDANNKLDFDQVLDIELELSTACNADCQLCYRNYKVFQEHYPERKIRTLEDIKQDIEKFKNLKDIRLVGSISEPTLYPDFLELVKYIKDKGITIEICTNGDTRGIKFWKELGSLLTKEDSVFFSICGLTQETHNRYRTGTSLENIIKNVHAFRTVSKNDYAQCIKFRYNEKELTSPAFYEFIDKNFSNIYETETFLLKDKDNYKDTRNIKDLEPVTSKDYTKVERLANLKFKSGMKLKTSCMSINNKSIQIDINGNIYPCYLFLEASKGEKWDMDYTRIQQLQDEVCKFCESSVQEYCRKNEMEYVI